MVSNGSQFQGSGKKLACLTVSEEDQIVKHVKWRSTIGCGVDWRQLQSIMQEILLGIKVANPSRSTGYEN